MQGTTRTTESTCSPEHISRTDKDSLPVNKLTLRFNDKDLEKRFQADHFIQTKTQIRVALWCLLAAITISGMPALIGHYGNQLKAMAGPQSLSMLMRQVYFINLPLIVIAVALAYTPLFQRTHQILMASSLSLQLIGIPLALHYLAPYLDSTVFRLITLIYIAGIIALFTVAKLQFVYAALIGSLIYILYSISITPKFRDFGDIYFAVQGTTVLLGLVFCGINLYQTEKTSRLNFFQRVLIKKQAQEIQEEHNRAERLLLNVLPQPVATRLKENHDTIADRVDSATILFADIVGFTPLSESMPPENLVNELNHIFSAFDRTVSRFDLEKIKTIGDAYMLAGGVPTPCEDHADRVVEAGISLMRELDQIAQTRNLQLDMRIGVHSGPVVAGVIGEHRFIYDLWGDTVNLASRLESHGIPAAIQISDAVYQRLSDRDGWIQRPDVNIKGKGTISTWVMQMR